MTERIENFSFELKLERLSEECDERVELSNKISQAERSFTQPWAMKDSEFIHPSALLAIYYPMSNYSFWNNDTSFLNRYRFVLNCAIQKEYAQKNVFGLGEDDASKLTKMLESTKEACARLYEQITKTR